MHCCSLYNYGGGGFTCVFSIWFHFFVFIPYLGEDFPFGNLPPRQFLEVIGCCVQSFKSTQVTVTADSNLSFVKKLCLRRNNAPWPQKGRIRPLKLPQIIHVGACRVRDDNESLFAGQFMVHGRHMCVESFK